MTEKDKKQGKEASDKPTEEDTIKIEITSDDDAVEGAADTAVEDETNGKSDEPAAEDAEKSTEDKLKDLEAEAKGNFDRCLRITAEFENYKKRSTREVENFRKYANETLIKDLLPIIDSLERAVASSDELDKNAGQIKEGIDLTLKEIFKTLEKHNVSPVEAVGQPFDPNFHEAAMQEPSDEHPGNTVIREFQKGYTIHDRLLRPAMVVVSKAVENNTAPKAESSPKKNQK